jgi:hypothetical protein
VTLVSGGGIRVLRAIERFTGAPIRRAAVPTAEMVARRRVDALVEGLGETLAGGPHPHAAGVVDRLLATGRPAADVAAAILHHFAPPRADDDFPDAFNPPGRPAAPRRPRRPHDRGPGAGRPAAGPRKIGPRSKKRPGR